jgi:hypothetical protein
MTVYLYGVFLSAQFLALVSTSHWATLCINLGVLYSSLILECLLLVVILLILGHLWCAGPNMSTLSAVGRGIILMVVQPASGLTLMGISSLGLVKLLRLTSVGMAMLNKSD